MRGVLEPVPVAEASTVPADSNPGVPAAMSDAPAATPPQATALVSKSIEFDAGHRVPQHESKCRNPHGHRYRVEVTCEGPIAPDGMVIDFGLLKQALVELVHDPYDHAMLVWEHDTELLEALEGHGWAIVRYPSVPTAENIAHELYKRLCERLPHDLRVVRVRVHETPTSVAQVPV